MPQLTHDKTAAVTSEPFNALIGEEFVSLLFDIAPTKVRTRIAKALDHYIKAGKLRDIDEEMGAIRLIAGQEELVVAIFEWLKINADLFPDHKDFVRRFKNHTVKLAFHPVLAQFRFLVGDTLTNGFVMEGLEHVQWTLKPVIEDRSFRLALVAPDGKEVLRYDPLHHDVSRGDEHGTAVVPHIVRELQDLISSQRKQTLKQYLSEMTEYRNLLLYANDGGYMEMGETLDQLFRQFDDTYRDLLWVLLALLGGKPISKTLGIVSQFIGVYREVLVVAGVVKSDGTLALPDAPT